MKTDKSLLESRVIMQTAKSRQKQKEKYRLARELGFSAYEAVILQNWGEKRIRELAKSKKNNT